MSRHVITVVDADSAPIVLPLLDAGGRPVAVDGWQVTVLLRAHPDAPPEVVLAHVAGDQVLVDTADSAGWPRMAVWELLVQSPDGTTQQAGYGGLRRSRRRMPPAPPSDAAARPATPGERIRCGEPGLGVPGVGPRVAAVAEVDPSAVTRLLARRGERGV